VPRELLEEWATKDPILRHERHLLDAGLADRAELDALAARVDAELAADLAAAEASPFPEPESGLHGVYADRAVGPAIPPLVEEWERRRPR